MSRGWIASGRALLHRWVMGGVHNAPTSLWPELLARALRIASRYPDVVGLQTCGVCGGGDLRTAVAGSRPIGWRLSPGGRRIPFGTRRLPLIYQQCEECGAARINPGFRDAWIDDYDGGRSAAPPAHWMEDEGYVADKRRSIMAHCEVADVNRFRSGGGSVLDVSCGAGVGLSVMRDQLGWRDCRGVECDPTAVRIARSQRQLQVQHGLLHTVELPAGHFDLVVMDNVLEHHARPQQAMGIVRRVLRAGGAVLIVVPNFHGHSVEQLGIDYWNLNWGHWHYFTAQSLTRLLQSSSFAVERVRCDHVEQIVSERLGVDASEVSVELDGATTAALDPRQRRFRGDYITLLAIAV